jgi:hypothetical protein
VSALREAAAVLRADAALAKPPAATHNQATGAGRSEAEAIKAGDDSTMRAKKLPTLTKSPVAVPAPPAAAAAVVPAPVPAPVPVPVPVAVAVAAPATAEQSAPVSIAQGLDQFLQRGNTMSVGELDGLRDGLIQCLGLLQSEIMSRDAVLGGEGGVVAGGVAPAVVAATPVAAPPVASVVVTEPAAPAVSATSADSSTPPDERELKTALGLLLKHRGGPGFGHGRLQGKSLEAMETTLRSVAQKMLVESVTAEE